MSELDLFVWLDSHPVLNVFDLILKQNTDSVPVHFKDKLIPLWDVEVQGSVNDIFLVKILLVFGDDMGHIFHGIFIPQ